MQQELPARFESRDLIPAIGLAVGLVVAVAAHAFFLWPWPVQVGFDEGFEAAVVERVIDGQWLPYVDGLSHRGPFLYWTQAIFHLLCGRFEWTGTRVLAMGCAVTITSCTFLAGWAAGWPLAGAAGALVYVFITCAVFPPGAGIGVHGEPIAAAYLMLGAFAVAYALYRERQERRRLVLLALGGALVAICALTKQTLALTAAPLFVWVLLHEGLPSLAPEARWRALRAHPATVFAAGGVGLVLLVVLRYAIVGELDTFLYWSTGFNAKSYLAPFRGRLLRTFLDWFWGSAWAMAGLVTALLVLVRPLAFIEERSWRGAYAGLRRGAFELGVAGSAVALFASGAVSMRFWDHYFLPALPFFGLAFGLLLESACRVNGKVNRIAQGAVLLILCTMAVTHPVQRLEQLRAQRRGGGWASHRPDAACTEIDRIAGPGRAPVFMWGTIGDLYITCQRPSASMFTYTTVLAGIIPPFWAPNKDLVTPGSRETLLQELKDEKPPVIIDFPISPGAAMMDIPLLASFVKASYCKLPTVKDKRGRDLRFFARKDLEACNQARQGGKKKTARR